MFISCPNCESKDLELEGQRYCNSDELIEIDVYKCLDCGCEFDELEGSDLNDDSWV